MAVGVWVICAERAQDAQRIAASGRMAFTLLRRGQLVAVPPPEEAERFLAEDARRRAQEGGGREGPGGGRPRRRTVVGEPSEVRRELLEVAREYNAEEVIAVNVTHSHEARRRSYELLADAFVLGGEPSARAEAVRSVSGA
jgi:alkanesulfonate monooxygenase SsuD/methylene tetrahydromethanopterin reductase-like flavin-dependent oxidoreductase (luciferase family)